ncbi:SGNH/GDSL hydrolase family protein [Nocardioides bruguierae]|uniref:SGNH/GDSL hydrolase family protein n=1 Tax=Nocardioides bruguierae TaxID=2945102 RepID=UPI00201FC50B|nr:SGNH/GDSL hydrolase family protein [Nocardioides bruguierae]MCL8025381.1 SGNH/GDSL hydrolase family protein [Nocardioides bruguierae]
MPSTRTRPLLALLGAAAASLALLAPVSPSATAAEREPLRYVALGDSYSAASGVLPLDPTAPPACLRSTRNYPHVLAGQIEADFTDVSCGAADTTHFATSQYPGVAPQLDALDRDVDLVTMTIGGNDSGVFIGAIQACGTAGLSTLGTGSPCKDEHGNEFVRTIRRVTYPSLVEALTAVRRAAPNAKVGILSYPWIMPRSEGCYPQMPIAEGDVPYLRRLQRVLNDAVARAAEATGVTYVGLNRLSDGHDACQPVGDRWVEPVLLGTNPVIVHPNAMGERKMANAARRQLGLR